MTNRFSRAAHHLGSAWDVATTGKYHTHKTPMAMEQRIEHVGIRLSDAVRCLFTGQDRASAMMSDIASAFDDLPPLTDPKSVRSAMMDDIAAGLAEDMRDDAEPAVRPANTKPGNPSM